MSNQLEHITDYQKQALNIFKEIDLKGFEKDGFRLQSEDFFINIFNSVLKEFVFLTKCANEEYIITFSIHCPNDAECYSIRIFITDSKERVNSNLYKIIMQCERLHVLEILKSIEQQTRSQIKQNRDIDVGYNYFARKFLIGEF